MSTTKKQRANQLKFGGIPEKNLYSSDTINLVDRPLNLADDPPNLADDPKKKFYSTGPRSRRLGVEDLSFKDMALRGLCYKQFT